MRALNYNLEISTPANTAESSPKETILKCEAGVIAKVYIKARPGAQELLHLRARHGRHQLWPKNTGEWYPLSDKPIEWNEYIKMTRDVNEIIIETYSEDDTYAHSCWINLNILPDYLVNPREGLGRVIFLLTQLLRRIGVRA